MEYTFDIPVGHSVKVQQTTRQVIITTVPNIVQGSSYKTEIRKNFFQSYYGAVSEVLRSDFTNINALNDAIRLKASIELIRS